MRTSWLCSAIVAVVGYSYVAAESPLTDDNTPPPIISQRALRTDRPPRGKLSDRIPNVTLIDHDGREVKFYDDIVRDRCVVVNFMYTVCKGICPGMTKNLAIVRDDLAAAGHDQFTFVSVSIEPHLDTPEQLTKYMRWNKIADEPGKPRWIFLTGKIEDIDALRRSLGVYEIDPDVDADRTQHGGIATFGNDRSNWWGAIPALMEPRFITEAVTRIAGDDSRGQPGKLPSSQLPSALSR